jgi:hypothetical protein
MRPLVIWRLFMKGPGMRLDLDVRRVWQCPACGAELRSDGNVVARFCNCTREGIAMRLVERPPPPLVRRPPREPEPDIPELSDFPTDIPVNPGLKAAPQSDPPDCDAPP